ncbi:MAG: chemotaxis response regulator protein-glutamate methylesterase [Peptococcia bacterium]
MNFSAQKIRVLVADDSALMRKIISDVINSDPQLEVIATARNGKEAYEKAIKLQPDVITMDVEMPILNGLEALDLIMGERPTPVVMLSALTHSGASATITALEKGAVDFIAKPSGTISPDLAKLSQEIISKVKVASEVQVTKIGGFMPRVQPKPVSLKPDLRSIVKGTFPIVVIGTSTGGPKALHEVMSSLPSGLNAAILIVQHMPPGFTRSLAQRLDSVSSFAVKEAEDGDVIERGKAYVAPGDYHMEIATDNGKHLIRLNQKPQVNGHRPAVDVLFHSAAKINATKVGVIMTGMGSDGALGLKALKEAGAVTIGESAETSVVYGMPKSAFKIGAVDYEVPLYKISEQIVQALRTK